MEQIEVKRILDISQAIPKEELVKRLKDAAKLLNDVEQGVDTSDINDFAACVASPFIINHKDNRVKVFAACCLTDLLRIYAPEPPYNDDNLKDIFCLFVNQLQYLKYIQDPSYKAYFRVLENLALVRTFNICIDIQGCQDIIVSLFKLFLTIVSEQHNARTKTYMLDIMCPLLQEGDSVSQELLDVILIHLVQPRKNEHPESYKLACNLIKLSSSYVQQYIQLFCNNIILGNAQNSSFKKKNLYELIYEIYVVDKSLLLFVLPQLEYKLTSSDALERLTTVKLIGKLMFASDYSTFAENNKLLWNAYLGRFRDMCPDVRMSCVKIAKKILSYEGASRTDLIENLRSSLHDHDDEVRLETLVTICDSILENIDLVHEVFFDGVIDRIRDKKPAIRNKAITCIGTIYRHLMNNPMVSKRAKTKLVKIPSKILHLYLQGNVEDRISIERVIYGYLVPITLPTEDRMKRLLNFHLSLDEAAAHAFGLMMKQRSKLKTNLVALLDAFKDKEREDNKNLFSSLTASLAKDLPEPQKAQIHLSKLLKQCEDKKTLDLLYTCVDVKQNCSTVKEAVMKVVGSVSAKNPMIGSVKALLDRSCSLLFDRASFTYLLKCIKNYVDDYGCEPDEDDEDILMKRKCGFKLITLLSLSEPSLFQNKACYEVLISFLSHQDPEIVEDTLKILEQILLKEGSELIEDVSAEILSVLADLIPQGSYKQAKYSLRCINLVSKEGDFIDRLFGRLVKDLNFEVSSNHLRCTLAALGEISKLRPGIFQKSYSKIIRDFAVKEVILIDREVTSSNDESDDEWGDEDNISEETLVKIAAIKLLTNWLLGVRRENAAENSKPVFRLFITLLGNDGDVLNEGKVSSKNRSRLRLAASLGLLKLLQNVNFVNIITIEQYQQLALTIQDSCYEVREKFTEKLHNALIRLKISLDYFAYLVLVAVDPVKERRLKVKQMIMKNAQTRRDYSKMNPAAAARPFAILPEYSLPYVIHLLAHHPDFVHTNLASLKEAKEYLWFFLEPIMGTKAENFSFLKKMVDNIKRTRDQQNPEDTVTNTRLYAICDVAIGCIMNKNKTFNLKDFPGNVVLPKKLYIQDKTLENSKCYIPLDLFTPQKPKLVDLTKNNNNEINAEGNSENIPAKRSGGGSGKSSSGGSGKRRKKGQKLNIIEGHNWVTTPKGTRSRPNAVFRLENKFDMLPSDSEIVSNSEVETD